MRKCISWATLALFAVVLGFWLTAAASAEIIQPGPIDGKDAEVRTASNQAVEVMNFGERAALQFRNTALSSREYIPYIQFDVSGLTEVASVKFSALSCVYNSSASSTVTREVGLYEVTSAWVEGDGNPAAPGEITYNNQPSFASTPVATLTIKATITAEEAATGGVWHVWDSADTGNSGFADLVNDWIDGTKENYGLRIWFSDDATTGEPAHEYRSSDYTGGDSDRPMLETTPVPEPGCVALLLCGVASLLLIARRRG